MTDGNLPQQLLADARYSVASNSLVVKHFAAIEPPSNEWLIEKYPGHAKTDNPTLIVGAAVAYPRAFNRVLAEWDAGRLALLYPPNHMMPYTILGAFFRYSRQRGEAKMHDLIGMSSWRKDATDKLMDAITGNVAPRDT